MRKVEVNQLKTTLESIGWSIDRLCEHQALEEPSLHDVRVVDLRIIASHCGPHDYPGRPEHYPGYKPFPKINE